MKTSGYISLFTICWIICCVSDLSSFAGAGIHYSGIKHDPKSMAPASPSGVQVNGTVKYFNTVHTPLDSSWVFLIQGGVKIDSVLTNNTGEYLFSNVSNGTFTIGFHSQKTWSGADTLDAKRIERHTALVQLFSEPVCLLAADVNNDGFINGTDALMVRRRAERRINQFSAADWVFAMVNTGGNSITISGSNITCDFFALCTGDVNGSRIFPPSYIPCQGIPTVNYGGQTYHTVRIGTQCWFRENLNIGTKIEPSQDQNPSNGIIEKYCYENHDSNCTIYGGLYQWNEMITCFISPNPGGLQGICPTGWHVASQEEWCTLSTFLESTYNYCWDYGWKGISVGGKLKESGTSRWNSPNTGATNSSFFSALPGGFKSFPDLFGDMGNNALFWTSTSASDYSSFYRNLSYNSAQIYDHDNYKNRGLSVRCIRDTCPPITIPDAGADQVNLRGTTVQLAGNAPAVNEAGTWSVIVGSCGIFGNIHDPLTTFSGKTGTSYVLRWKMTNFCYDTIYDDVSISFALSTNSCPGFDSITHIGSVYHTVQIGTQCWLRENLDAGTMIPSNQSQTNNGNIEKYCYQNNPVNCCIYGAYYHWDEALQYAPGSNNVPSGIQGICPTGWHIPSDNEWDTLVYYLGWTKTAGGKLKETGDTYWFSPNSGATNETGFSAFGSGDRDWAGGTGAIKERVSYWSTFNSMMRRMNYSDAILFRSSPYSSAAYSVRCIKDPCPSIIPATTALAGSDQLTLNCTQTVLSANSPGSTELGAWNIISGNGGVIDSLNNPHSSFTGIAGQPYLLRWTISNICGGISRDDVTISFKGFEGVPCVGIPTITYGGQTYHTVQVGSQCWLKENLNIGSMVDSLQNQANNSVIEKYCYRNDPASCLVFGGLYQWDEMMQYSTTPGVKGICPTDWHLPVETEWTEMITYLGGSADAGGKLKSTCQQYWNSPNTGASNRYGFFALGSGSRYSPGTFNDKNGSTYFWSSEASGVQAKYKMLTYNSAAVTTDWISRQSGFPVRCVHDCGAPTSSNAGPDQLNIQGTVVILAANAPGPGETGLWSIRSGNSGTFENAANPLSAFSGQSEQAYNLQWTITNSCGNSSYDTLTISYALPANACPGIPVVVYEGKTYHTIQIGTQCWMKENLDVGLIKSSFEPLTNNGIIEKYCYDDDPLNCEVDGAFYSWDEMMNYVASSNLVPSGIQGICPVGWHIPSDAEWDILTLYLGGSGVAGGKMKETSSCHWYNPNVGATDEFGFDAHGTGDRGWDGSFSAYKGRVSFWSSYDSWMRRMQSDNAELLRSPPYSSAAYSVRCLKD